jgi:hypothetical protein
MSGSPATPPAADLPPGARLALVVATATYDDAGLRRLRSPAQDVGELAQVLADPDIGGFAVTTVIDQPVQQIRLAIAEFLAGRSPQDLVLVYLSCHGLLDARRRLYFAATDTRKDLLGATAVESAWVLDQLESCRARRQVLILDSCFSGALAHGAMGEAGLGLDRFLGHGRGRAVLTASAATEYSFEGEPTDAAIPPGSVFTAALVQGLRTGAADTDRDGYVSVDDAYAYVFHQVQATGAVQTPSRWLYGAEARIMLARSPAGPAIARTPLPESLRADASAPVVPDAAAPPSPVPPRVLSVFEVAIGPGTVPDSFRVEVVSSPVGEASALVRLDAGALLARRGELQQAVLASAVATRRALPETERCVREAGQALFAALLGAGEVAGRYRASAAVAAERGEELRVVLRIEDPVLAGLPWEAMWDEAVGGYVCRRDQLVRHVLVPSAATPLAVDPPMRILGIVSSPRGLPALDVAKEKEQLERALARLTSQGLAEVVWAPSATWADLQDALLGGIWHVVHYVGHGDFDPARDEGVLALVRADGRADLVAASRLVDLLRQAQPVPRLVVLNSCSGAAAGVADLFSGTAAALVRGGVSAVAAMQYEISDPAAVAFARGFHGAIARGRGVDEAVSSGRVAIMGLSGQTLEWVTPVLYLRGHDSRLFACP